MMEHRRIERCESGRLTKRKKRENLGFRDTVEDRKKTACRELRSTVEDLVTSRHLIGIERRRVVGADSLISERHADMFCNDMFGESPAGGCHLRESDGCLEVDRSCLINNHFKSRIEDSVASRDSIVIERNRVVGAGTLIGERHADIFSDDMFGESPAGGCRLGEADGCLTANRSCLIDSCVDNWDDAEGYYSFRIGEVLDGRYKVLSAHGRGVFSTVVRARDMKAGRGEPREVAIKITRNNETMYEAGQQELVILKKLAGADPENKRHHVRLLSSFKYRRHLCLVMEFLHMNLRETRKKFGRSIKLNEVREYAEQILIALKHLRDCGVLHCDIKPDNMLVNESRLLLKLCDFGSAMSAGENEIITPYLVSRFYRAPEIILGLPYDHALDIWSVGCCLYELYTGKMLFEGNTNHDMLRLHMELKGPFPKKMLKKAAFADQHFDKDFNFRATVTNKGFKRVLGNVKPKGLDIPVAHSGTDDSKLLVDFKDLLEKMFILDPDKRLTVSQALSHPFISTQRVKHSKRQG